MPSSPDRQQIKLFAESMLTPVRPAAVDFDTLTPGSTWRHHSGRAYTVRMVTNTDASDPLRYPVTVVYTDTKGRVWSKSVPRFLAGMKRVDSSELLDAVMQIGQEVFEACGRRYSPSRIRAYYLKHNFDRAAVVALLVARDGDR